MRWPGSAGPQAQRTAWLAARDRSAAAGPQETDRSETERKLVTRYWLANTWVEVLPDGVCFISPYEGGTFDTGTVASATEDALADVACRIDRGVPLVHTSAWADPDREVPALDNRDPVRDAIHHFPRASSRKDLAQSRHRCPVMQALIETTREGNHGD